MDEMRGEEENEAAPATEAHPPILEDDARAVLRQMNARSLKWKELVELAKCPPAPPHIVQPPPLVTMTREKQEHTQCTMRWLHVGKPLRQAEQARPEGAALKDVREGKTHTTR